MDSSLEYSRPYNVSKRSPNSRFDLNLPHFLYIEVGIISGQETAQVKKAATVINPTRKEKTLRVYL